MSDVTVESPKTLRNFASSFHQKHSSKWPSDEHELALEFITYFGLPPLPKIEDYKGLASQLAIEVSIAQLPPGLRGYNSHFQERRQIVLERLEGPAEHIGISEHTFLHELRELIEYEFRREGHPSASGTELEERAESFAKTVRTLAPMRFIGDWLGEVLEMQSGWKYLAVGGLIAFSLVHVFVCFVLPHHEEYFRKLK
jgi:hypothetical protein